MGTAPPPQAAAPVPTETTPAAARTSSGASGSAFTTSGTTLGAAKRQARSVGDQVEQRDREILKQIEKDNEGG